MRARLGWWRWRLTRVFRPARPVEPVIAFRSAYPEMGGAYGPNWPAGSAPASPRADCTTTLVTDWVIGESPLMTRGQRARSVHPVRL